MKNYLDLLQDILDNGYSCNEERTGVGTIKVFDRTLRFDMEKGFPILTSRRVSLRIAFEELMWMMRGDCSAKTLQEKNIHIWDGNTTKEFQKSVGLDYLPEGHIGKGYGYQIRNFGGTESVQWDDGTGNGVDQLTAVVESIKNDPHGRRHIMSYWNPLQLKQAVLPPCHLYCQFVVTGKKLNLTWLQRSVDTVYGLPYNIMFYGLFLTLMSRITGYFPGELVFHGVDCHIYQNQIEIVKEQLTRQPRPLPAIVINPNPTTLEEMLDMSYDQVALSGYDPYPDFKNKPGMAV